MTARASGSPQPSRQRPTNRREILKGLSLAGVASSSVAAATVPAQAEEPAADDGRVSYQETDHIRRYYDLARR